MEFLRKKKIKNAFVFNMTELKPSISHNPQQTSSKIHKRKEAQNSDKENDNISNNTEEQEDTTGEGDITGSENEGNSDTSAENVEKRSSEIKKSSFEIKLKFAPPKIKIKPPLKLLRQTANIREIRKPKKRSKEVHSDSFYKWEGDYNRKRTEMLDKYDKSFYTNRYWGILKNMENPEPATSQNKHFYTGSYEKSPFIPIHHGEHRRQLIESYYNTPLLPPPPINTNNASITDRRKRKRHKPTCRHYRASVMNSSEWKCISNETTHFRIGKKDKVQISKLGRAKTMSRVLLDLVQLIKSFKSSNKSINENLSNGPNQTNKNSSSDSFKQCNNNNAFTNKNNRGDSNTASKSMPTFAAPYPTSITTQNPMMAGANPNSYPEDQALKQIVSALQSQQPKKSGDNVPGSGPCKAHAPRTIPPSVITFNPLVAKLTTAHQLYTSPPVGDGMTCPSMDAHLPTGRPDEMAEHYQNQIRQGFFYELPKSPENAFKRSHNNENSLIQKAKCLFSRKKIKSLCFPDQKQIGGLSANNVNSKSKPSTSITKQSKSTNNVSQMSDNTLSHGSFPQYNIAPPPNKPPKKKAFNLFSCIKKSKGAKTPAAKIEEVHNYKPRNIYSGQISNMPPTLSTLPPPPISLPLQLDIEEYLKEKEEKRKKKENKEKKKNKRNKKRNKKRNTKRNKNKKKRKRKCGSLSSSKCSSSKSSSKSGSKSSKSSKSSRSKRRIIIR